MATGELEFRWMLHDRHLYTVHKVPVRFQRCLACMVAKQGPCGDHKATWLCRSRLTDAPPGVDVQNGQSCSADLDLPDQDKYVMTHHSPDRLLMLPN